MTHRMYYLQHILAVCALGEYHENPIGFQALNRFDNEEQLQSLKFFFDAGQPCYIALSHIARLASTSSNTPASYIRLMLRKTIALADAEAPRVQFDPCFQHDMWGTVDNVEVRMKSDREGPASIQTAFHKLLEEGSTILKEQLMAGYILPTSRSKNPAGFFWWHRLHVRRTSVEDCWFLFRGSSCEWGESVRLERGIHRTLAAKIPCWSAWKEMTDILNPVKRSIQFSSCKKGFLG